MSKTIPDKEINGVIVGKSKSKRMWAWYCPKCGEGALISDGREECEKKARLHVCASDRERLSYTGAREVRSDSAGLLDNGITRDNQEDGTEYTDELRGEGDSESAIPSNAIPSNAVEVLGDTADVGGD